VLLGCSIGWLECKKNSWLPDFEVSVIVITPCDLRVCEHLGFSSFQDFGGQVQQEFGDASLSLRFISLSNDLFCSLPSALQAIPDG
jgi:hypothetical protein